MQRVRIGLTGLAFVFVLVLLGAIFSSASDEERITANMLEQQRVSANSIAPVAAPEQANEPLAELGVVPGNADANLVEPAPAQIPTP